MKEQGKELLIAEQNQEETYLSIRGSIINAQNKVKATVNPELFTEQHLN